MTMIVRPDGHSGVFMWTRQATIPQSFSAGERARVTRPHCFSFAFIWSEGSGVDGELVDWITAVESRCDASLRLPAERGRWEKNEELCLYCVEMGPRSVLERWSYLVGWTDLCLGSIRRGVSRWETELVETSPADRRHTSYCSIGQWNVCIAIDPWSSTDRARLDRPTVLSCWCCMFGRSFVLWLDVSLLGTARYRDDSHFHRSWTLGKPSVRNRVSSEWSSLVQLEEFAVSTDEYLKHEIQCLFASSMITDRNEGPCPGHFLPVCSARCRRSGRNTWRHGYSRFCSPTDARRWSPVHPSLRAVSVRLHSGDIRSWLLWWRNPNDEWSNVRKNGSQQYRSVSGGSFPSRDRCELYDWTSGRIPDRTIGDGRVRVDRPRLVPSFDRSYLLRTRETTEDNDQNRSGDFPTDQ